MDDFLFRLRHGKLKNGSDNRKSGNYREQKNYSRNEISIQTSDIARILDAYEAHLKQMSDLAERKAEAEEQKAVALSGIEALLTRLTGHDAGPEKNNLDHNQPPRPENGPEEGTPETVETNEARENQPQLETDDLSPWSRQKQKLIDDIKRMREKGMTFNQITHYLQTNNVPTLSGRGRWYAATVANLLK